MLWQPIETAPTGRPFVAAHMIEGRCVGIGVFTISGEEWDYRLIDRFGSAGEPDEWTHWADLPEGGD